MLSDIGQICWQPPVEDFSDCNSMEVEHDPRLLDHGSISFGRFATETLAWEKWSVFSQNKCKEELAKCSAPGSVAKKKAYFEEYYKKLAAQKALKEQEEREQRALGEQEVQSQEEAQGMQEHDSNTEEEERHREFVSYFSTEKNAVSCFGPSTHIPQPPQVYPCSVANSLYFLPPPPLAKDVSCRDDTHFTLSNSNENVSQCLDLQGENSQPLEHFKAVDSLGEETSPLSENENKILNATEEQDNNQSAVVQSMNKIVQEGSIAGTETENGTQNEESLTETPTEDYRSQNDIFLEESLVEVTNHPLEKEVCNASSKPAEGNTDVFLKNEDQPQASTTIQKLDNVAKKPDRLKLKLDYHAANKSQQIKAATSKTRAASPNLQKMASIKTDRMMRSSINSSAVPNLSSVRNGSLRSSMRFSANASSTQKQGLDKHNKLGSLLRVSVNAAMVASNSQSLSSTSSSIRVSPKPFSKVVNGVPPTRKNTSEEKQVTRKTVTGLNRSSVSTTLAPKCTVPRPFSLSTEKRVLKSSENMGEKVSVRTSRSQTAKASRVVKKENRSEEASNRATEKNSQLDNGRFSRDNVRTPRTPMGSRVTKTAQMKDVGSCTTGAVGKGRATTPVTSSASFSFRSSERAEKRKEFKMKMEEKQSAKETLKNQGQARLKEDKESDLKSLRRNLNFKANPLPNFYHEAVPPKAEPRKMATRPRTPNTGRKNAEGEAILAKSTQSLKIPQADLNRIKNCRAMHMESPRKNVAPITRNGEPDKSKCSATRPRNIDLTRSVDVTPSRRSALSTSKKIEIPYNTRSKKLADSICSSAMKLIKKEASHIETSRKLNSEDGNDAA